MPSRTASSLFRSSAGRVAPIVAGFLIATGFLLGPVSATVILDGCGDAASDFGTSCSLAELDPLGPVTGGTITINDKIFENWTATRTTSTFGNNDFFRAGIRVDPIDDPLNPGVKFVDTNGAWNHDVEFSFDDITFDVRVLSGQALIKDVELITEVGRIAAGTPPNGIDGFVNVDYLVTNGVVESVETTCGLVSCANTTITDSVTFAPHSAIHLSGSVNVIAAQAPGAGAGAQVISHTVLISQVSVPQPSALALLSLGMLWAVASRIRGRCAGRTGARRR